MATAVFFHAHPDDEALSTGGTMLLASRAALRAHASQIPSDSFMVSLPVEAFELAFGTEWFIRRGARAEGPPETDLFASLASPSATTG